jgi:hypothetical protein
MVPKIFNTYFSPQRFFEVIALSLKNSLKSPGTYIQKRVFANLAYTEPLYIKDFYSPIKA